MTQTPIFWSKKAIFLTVLSHFLTLCALSFDSQATQRPHICPKVNFKKSLRGFRRYLTHWNMLGSDITDLNFHWNQAPAENSDFLLSHLKSAETPKMGLISISNDIFVNWTKFERNRVKNKRFQFFVAGTPDSRKTFFKIALISLRVVRS